MFIPKSIIACLLLIISVQCIAQSLRFGSGAFVGFTMAQVDGDDMQGYDKPGLTFGIKGMAFILPKFEIHTELSYAQQGSQSKNFEKNVTSGRKLILDYGGVTGLLVINDWWHPLKEFYRFQLLGGASVKRMIRSDSKDIPGRQIQFKELSPYFETTDISMVLGMNFRLSKKVGTSFRYHRSMNKILDADYVKQFFERKQLISMKGYYISVDMFYSF